MKELVVYLAMVLFRANDEEGHNHCVMQTIIVVVGVISLVITSAIYQLNYIAEKACTAYPRQD